MPARSLRRNYNIFLAYSGFYFIAMQITLYRRPRRALFLKNNSVNVDRPCSLFTLVLQAVNLQFLSYLSKLRLKRDKISILIPLLCLNT